MSSRFKVGDKVKRIFDKQNPYDVYFEENRIYTVSFVEGNSIRFFNHDDDTKIWYNSTRFKLVEEKKLFEFGPGKYEIAGVVLNIEGHFTVESETDIETITKIIFKTSQNEV